MADKGKSQKEEEFVDAVDTWLGEVDEKWYPKKTEAVLHFMVGKLGYITVEGEKVTYGIFSLSDEMKLVTTCSFSGLTLSETVIDFPASKYSNGLITTRTVNKEKEYAIIFKGDNTDARDTVIESIKQAFEVQLGKEILPKVLLLQKERLEKKKKDDDKKTEVKIEDAKAKASLEAYAATMQTIDGLSKQKEELEKSIAALKKERANVEKDAKDAVDMSIKERQKIQEQLDGITKDLEIRNGELSRTTEAVKKLTGKEAATSSSVADHTSRAITLNDKDIVKEGDIFGNIKSTDSKEKIVLELLRLSDGKPDMLMELEISGDVGKAKNKIDEANSPEEKAKAEKEFRETIITIAKKVIRGIKKYKNLKTMSHADKLKILQKMKF